MQEWDGILSLVIIPHLVVVWVFYSLRVFSPVSYQVDEIVKGRLLKIRAIFAPTSAMQRLVFLDALSSTYKHVVLKIIYF